VRRAGYCFTTVRPAVFVLPNPRGSNSLPMCDGSFVAVVGNSARVSHLRMAVAWQAPTDCHKQSIGVGSWQLM
jgi:hypothetical protein